MEKKIKDWFQELEEPYRALALKNLKEECKEEYTYSLSGALAVGFSWHKTKQGHLYWNKLFHELQSNDLYLVLALSKYRAFFIFYPPHPVIYFFLLHSFKFL